MICQKLIISFLETYPENVWHALKRIYYRLHRASRGPIWCDILTTEVCPQQVLLLYCPTCYELTGHPCASVASDYRGGDSLELAEWAVVFSRSNCSLVNLKYCCDISSSKCRSLTRLWYAHCWSRFLIISCTHQQCFLRWLCVFNCINLCATTISNNSCCFISNKHSCILDWLSMFLSRRRSGKESATVWVNVYMESDHSHTTAASRLRLPHNYME